MILESRVRLELETAAQTSLILTQNFLNFWATMLSEEMNNAIALCERLKGTTGTGYPSKSGSTLLLGMLGKSMEIQASLKQTTIITGATLEREIPLMPLHMIVHGRGICSWDDLIAMRTDKIPRLIPCVCKFRHTLCEPDEGWCALQLFAVAV